MTAPKLGTIVLVRPPLLRWVLFQLVLSSPTHGPTSRPCRIHRFSVGVSLMVILSTFTSHVRPSDSAASRLHPTGAYRCLPPCGKPFFARRPTSSSCGPPSPPPPKKPPPLPPSSPHCPP